MAQPSTPATWEGGWTVPVQPPAAPQFGSAVPVVAAQLSADSGVLVSYDGTFTRQFWSTGGIVPFLIERLPPKQVAELREQILEQLKDRGTGLDEIPLRAFAEAARLYTETASSGRFAQASFGAISQPATGGIVGQVSWPDGVAGTVVTGVTDGVAGQTHPTALPDVAPVPLRQADARSLADALAAALASQALDPLWTQLLNAAEQAIA